MIDNGVLPQGFLITEDPTGHPGVVAWCNYCKSRLYPDWRHMGHSPFLSLLVKVADGHRGGECPSPDGPFNAGWDPRGSKAWILARDKGSAA